MPKQLYQIELEERQYQFLEQMVRTYGLPDIDKAIRILIDYSVESDPQVRQTIWNEVRCLDC